MCKYHLKVDLHYSNYNSKLVCLKNKKYIIFFAFLYCPILEQLLP